MDPWDGTVLAGIALIMDGGGLQVIDTAIIMGIIMAIVMDITRVTTGVTRPGNPRKEVPGSQENQPIPM